MSKNEFVRDERSQALINNDNAAYVQHKQLRNKLKKQNSNDERLKLLEDKIRKLEEIVYGKTS